MVNVTAENLGEIVALSHEFAIGLAEHFDVLDRVSKGDLHARVTGTSGVDLLESLKGLTNQMVESVSSEILNRKQAQEELKLAHSELEKRVEKRTRELAKANEQLRCEIQERKRTEGKLKNFVHLVSHDLKTPIIAIQGYSSRLSRRYQGVLGDKGRMYLSQIETSARRMELLVSDLLAFARVGELACSFARASSSQIVSRVISVLKPVLKHKKIRVVVQRGFPAISCDEERIQRVFENLVINAIKFLGETADPFIEIGYEDKGATHCFFVRDNGIGIEPKYQHKIFELFARLKQVDGTEGSGLGLPIVEKIVQSHGGTVWVKSEKGQGATFYFTLPKEPAES